MKTQTPQRPQTRWRGIAWVLAGFGLQVLGAVLIWRTLPDFGLDAMGGVAAVVLGSLLITWGVVQRARQGSAAAPATEHRGGWLPEPELRGAPPRAVRLSKSGRRMVAWWVFLLMAIPFYTWFVTQRAGGPRVDHLEDYIEATATIHDKTARDTVPGRRHYLYYNFPLVPGGQIRASVSVSESDYNKFNVGDSLKVLYLGPNPSVHEVLDLKSSGADASRVIWFAAGVAAMLLAVFEMIRRRHKKITVFGAPVAGKVDMAYRRGAGCVYSVRCDVGGVESTIRASERGAAAVKEGDSITVLYLPQKPEQRLIYRLSMYEAVGES